MANAARSQLPVLEDPLLHGGGTKKGKSKVMSADATQTFVLEKQQEIDDEIQGSRVQSAEAEARKILNGLGFTRTMQDQPTKHFSGGWRMRISLARALFVQPTLLMLDEPTNHLDLNAVLWLNDYLQGWRNTLLVVSHDQDFLDSVVTHIIHLDHKKLKYYEGGFEKFKIMYRQNLDKMKTMFDQQQKQLSQMLRSGKSRAEAEAAVASRVRKSDKAGGDDGPTTSIATSAAGPTLMERPQEYMVRFDFGECEDLSSQVIEMRDVCFGYPKRHADGTTTPPTDEDMLFHNVNIGIDQTTRATIVGPNGVGKTTLLRLMMKEIDPLEGEVIHNRFLRIGRYSQHFVDNFVDMR